MKRLAAFLLLFAGVGYLSASANPPPVVTGNYPAYGGFLSEPSAWSKQDVRDLLESQKAIHAELKEIRKALAGGKAVKQEGADPAALYRTYCAACHTPATADSGGGFELFRDDAAKELRRFTPGEKAKILDRVNRGTMPPRKMPQPTAAEKAAFE